MINNNYKLITMYSIIQEVTSMITVLNIVRLTGLIFPTIYVVNCYVS